MSAKHLPRPPKTPPKAALKDELLTAVSADLETLERAQKAAMEGATHEEAKPENDKDTRALEQSYLARGQAARVEQLRSAVAELGRMSARAFGKEEPVGVGALVTVEEEERATKLLIAPHGGGTRLAQGTIQVVTPQSPLGEALVGRNTGDVCEVFIGGRMREFEIIRVE